MSIKRNGRTPKQRANTMRMLDPKKRGAMIENAQADAVAHPDDPWAVEYLAAVLAVAESMGIDTVKP